MNIIITMTPSIVIFKIKLSQFYTSMKSNLIPHLLLHTQLFSLRSRLQQEFPVENLRSWG